MSDKMKRERGFGSIYQPAWRDKKTGTVKQSPTWWVSYYNRGRLIRESAKSDNRTAAVKLLKKRHAAIEAGRPVGPDVEKTTFEEMTVMLTNDYKANGRKSLARVEDAINHLRETFADYRAVEISGDRVTCYITQRQQDGAAASTINNELAALSRMFTLAMRAGKAAGKPYIAKLQLNNARKGFFEQEQFQAVLKHLGEDYKAVVQTAFITGWRLHDELLTRQRHHVDLKAGWLRLEPGETKNREGRMFPLTPRLREVLQAQIEHTEDLQRAQGKIIPWLFHRDGKPIKGFRKVWLTALVKAGLATEVRDARGRLINKIASRILHDFRRTAVRNLERAGVPRSAAMKMVGHKTQSIYSRYAIADESMLKDAAVKLEQLHLIDKQTAFK